MASLLLTYFFWLIGGVFGLHHLYLGRVNQAVVWCVTLGGVFGLGCFRDLWRIPFYVQWRNREKVCQKQHLTHLASQRRPSSGVIRILGMFIIGYMASIVLSGLLPSNKKDDTEISMMYLLFHRVCSGFLVMAGSSIGVYIVANIGEMQCSFFYPMVGSLLSTPWLVMSESNASMPTLIASLVTWWFGLQWRPFPTEASSRSAVVNVLIFLACVSLWTSIFCYGVYYHAEITVNNGEKVPFRDALRNFFASPAWGRLKDSFHKIFMTFWSEGWKSALRDAIDTFEFSGEANARRVLGLDKNAGQDVINRQCRKLSSQFHPDRQKTPTAKDEAAEQFLKIREACNVLSRKPYQRTRYS